MTMIVEKAGSNLIKIWAPEGHEVEPAAMQQMRNIAAMPFIHRHVAGMPDIHLGKGATVGSVIPTVGAIIPAAVGVDIGCGMAAVRTSLKASDLPDNLSGLRSEIEARIPHGRSDDGGKNDVGAWRDAPKAVLDAMATLKPGLAKIADQHQRMTGWLDRAHTQLCSLGTGNHFVESCLDENQNVWMMLHSGSRGVGNAIGQHFISLAKKDMERWFINLPDKDLAYIPEGSEHFGSYIGALSWAQSYARTNRALMMSAAIEALKATLGRDDFTFDCEAVNCHHNYVSKERHFGKDVWLTRKGAVDASEGTMGIIPGSMGAKSFIVRGKGNREAFCSCSHGAGRKMSRTAAQKLFTLEDHIKATAGVECRKDKDVIDETPMAYKDIDAVMAAQTDMVEIVATLKQVVCVKG
jgi:tRNA-splicing ligase RtcB